jgi:type III secretion system FlhB-like substrate exporter
MLTTKQILNLVTSIQSKQQFESYPTARAKAPEMTAPMDGVGSLATGDILDRAQDTTVVRSENPQVILNILQMDIMLYWSALCIQTRPIH